MSASQPDIAEIASNPEVQQLTLYTQQLFEVGSNYKIETAGHYEVAAIELKRVKDAQKKLDDLRRAITRPLDAAKKAVLDLFRSPESKLTQAESGIKRAMIGFQQAQDRIRREEQAKAEAEARRKQAQLQERASKALASGKPERAMELEHQAATVVAPVVHRAAPNVTGINTRDVWKFEVTDPALVPREYLMVDEKKLGAVVRALKGDTTIAGVRVWPEQSIAAGSAA